MTKIIQSIPYPTYTTAQRDALTDVLLNTKINNSTTGKVEEYNGSIWIEQGGGSGSTDLSFSGSSINGIIISNTGSDATIPLGDGTNSGLSINNYPTTEKNKLANIAENANVGVVPNLPITGATHTKITYDAKGLVVSGSTLIANDIPNIAESQVVNLTTDLGNKADRVSISGATYTKISYNSQGIVTGGTDATTADIAASTNKNYITDSDQTKLSLLPLSPIAEIPSGDIDGNNLIFTLSTQPSNSLGVVVILDGFVQYNTIDYNVVNQTITFTTAPASGSTIFTNYIQSTVSQTGLTSTDVNSLIDNRMDNAIYGSTLVKNNSIASGTTVTDVLTNIETNKAVTRKIDRTAWVATDITLTLTYDVERNFAYESPVAIITTVTITLTDPPIGLAAEYWFKFLAGTGWGFNWPSGYTASIGNDVIVSGSTYTISFKENIYTIKKIA